jgi:hypothetical protein
LHARICIKLRISELARASTYQKNGYANRNGAANGSKKTAHNVILNVAKPPRDIQIGMAGAVSARLQPVAAIAG